MLLVKSLIFKITMQKRMECIFYCHQNFYSTDKILQYNYFPAVDICSVVFTFKTTEVLTVVIEEER